LACDHKAFVIYITLSYVQHVKVINLIVTMDTASIWMAFATTLTTAEMPVTKDTARIHQVGLS